MKAFRYILIIVFLNVFLYSLVAAQTKQDRVAGGHLTSPLQTNARALQEGAKTMKKDFRKRHRQALRYARENNLPVRKVAPNGKVTELQTIDYVGQPRYYTTFEDAPKRSTAAEAATTTSTDQVWEGGSLALGLDGSSAHVTGKLGIWDASGVLRTHQELNSRVTQQDSPQNSTDGQDHATHVSGIMVGAGVNARAKGMAFKTTLKAYDWNNDLSEAATAAAAGLLLSNHSYGLGNVGWVYNSDRTGSLKWEWHGNTTISATEDYRFGYYDSESQQIDKMAVNAPNYLMVVAAGNDRTSSGPGSGASYYLGTTNQTSTVARRNQDTFDLLTAAAVAKNILTVGAVSSIAGGYQSAQEVENAYFSNWGPTDDGRIKPDLAGDGVDVYSAVATANNAYAYYSGTSMAAPNITGSLLLLQEHYGKVNANALMRAATLKGLAIHTANEAGTAAGPDYSYGWGLLNTAQAAEVISNADKTHQISEHTLTQGKTDTLQVIASGKSPIKATLSWTDPAATPLTINTSVVNNRKARLVNDLDVLVSDAKSTWRPWVLDPANFSAAATTGDNLVDNVEQVLIANPVAGNTYKVVVKHKGTLTNISQPYSLILSGIGGQAYCSSEASSSQGARIAQVIFGSINNTNPTACTTYSDFTNLSTNLTIGAVTATSLTVKLGTCVVAAAKVVKVYIDWNHDGDFEDGNETIGTSGVISGNGEFTTTVQVPAGVEEETFTRMRVVVVETSNAAEVSACGTYAKGETQDYSLHLVGAAADVALVSLVSPTEASCLGAQTVKVRIRNNGDSPVSNIPVAAIIKSGNNTLATFTGLYTNSLPINRETELELNGSFAFSAGQPYTVEVSTGLSGDEVAANNSLFAAITLTATEPPVAQASSCGTGAVSLTASGAGTTYWYDAETGGNLVAIGNQATTTVIPESKTYYAALNDFYGTVAPATKSVFGGGGYGGGFVPTPLITTYVPLVLDSARLYIGNSGKLTFTVETENDSIVSSTTIEVKATRSMPVAADAADDPNDTGAMYPLKLAIPAAGSYRIRMTYHDRATVFRSNTNVTGYPFTLPGVISLTGALYEEEVLTTAYYYLYNLKVKALDCPSERVAVTTQTNEAFNVTVVANGGTTVCEGETVALSVEPQTSGLTYQWQKDGVVIKGAVTASYAAAQSGSYSVVMSNNACSATTNTVEVSVITVSKPTLSLLEKTLTSSAASGNQWFLNGVAIAGATNTRYVAPKTGSYTVQVTSNGCTATSDPIQVEVPIFRALKVYPNPATAEYVKIDYTTPGTPERVQAKIYDTIGRLLAQPSLELIGDNLYEYQMALGNLASGMYFIRVEEDGNVLSERLLIAR